jgi:hypothetical protein
MYLSCLLGRGALPTHRPFLFLCPTELRYTDPFSDRIDAAAALAEWQASRTGPLAEFGPSHQFLFKRFEKGLSLFEDYSDPSTGPTTPHAEVVILVCIPRID